MPRTFINSTSAPALVRFTSRHARLIVYKDGMKIAQFVDGSYAANDPDVIAALRACALCDEAP